MRIQQLDLLAFGPFTSAALFLDGGRHGLHVVYGTNEAGKSSALRALSQILFGIPHLSKDNFLHAHTELRIGAKFLGSDGVKLECIRRKGKSNTLRGADDMEVIESARLEEMLSGIDEATFAQQFGINSTTLEQGGRALVEGQGDVGAALFAAGTGIVDLRKVQEQLEQEAEALFKPGGKNPRINKAIADWKKARETIREKQLPSTEWTQHDQALTAAQERKQEIEASLRQKAATQSKLERIAQAKPLVARRNLDRRALAEVASAPLLAAGFADKRRESFAELRANQNTEQEKSNLLRDLERQIETLNPPQQVLTQEAIIEQLYADLGAHRKAKSDRPAIEKERLLFEDEGRSILKELGHPPDLANVEKLRIDRLSRQQIQTLGNDFKALEGKAAAAQERVEALRGEIEQIESSLAYSGPIPEVTSLKRTLQSARQRGNLDERITEADDSCQALRRQAEVDLKKLFLWQGSLEALEALAVPALETIERFEADWADAETEAKRVQAALADTDAKLRQIEQSLQRLQLAQDVPTEHDLTRTRQRRDDGWQLVREAWLEGRENTKDGGIFISEFEPGGKLADAYEASVVQADQVADRLRREAERVAEKANLIANQQNLVEYCGKLEKEQTQNESQRRHCESQWKLQWQPLRIEPLLPREMRSWQTRHSQLAAAAAEIRRQEGQIAELKRQRDASRQEVSQSLVEIGQVAAGTAEGSEALAARGEAIVERLEQERQTQEQQREQLQRQSGELRDAERKRDQAARALNQWEEQWRAATVRLSLPPEASPEQAIVVLSALDELFAKLAQAEDRRRRVNGIDRDSQQFVERLGMLAQTLECDVVKQSVEDAVAGLHHQLILARQMQARAEDLKKQQDREQTALQNLRESISRWQSILEVMCAEAGCQTPDELPAAEERSARRRRLEEEVKETELRILALAGGTALEEFLEQVAAVRDDELASSQRQITEEIEALENEKAEVLQTIGSELNERKRMDGSAQAAQAEEDARALVAQLQTDLAQYGRLRLAAGILRRAIERYREKHQGPVVARASELFGELTLGSFEGLRADYNEEGKLVLVGVRPGGRQTVVVECMSDGARDQLYLALRLASLEVSLARHEPIPFIVDDILIKFDDDRAVAALKALARLSEKTQVIFFTPHSHLVELARANLDEDVLFTHLLDCRAATESRAAVTGRI